MNKQSGVIEAIWLYMAGAIALIVALTGLVAAWNSYTTRLYQDGYDSGKDATEKAYVKRDNAQLQAVIAAQKAAEIRAAQAEALAAAAQAEALTNYQKGIDDGKAKTAVLVAAARAGTLKLRDPGAKTGSSTACGGGIAQAAPIAAIGGSDEAKSADLSATASEFLLELTGEADDVARQLILAQARILSDLKVCNGP